MSVLDAGSIATKKRALTCVILLEGENQRMLNPQFIDDITITNNH